MSNDKDDNSEELINSAMVKNFVLLTNSEELMLITLHKQSKTYQEFFNKIGLVKNFHNLEKIRLIFKKHNYSPFKKPNTKLPFNEQFCQNSPIERSTIKRIIRRENLIDYKCSECGVGEIWNGKELSLHLEHKNGINNDHRLDNLTFLCPNCHSQTTTYSNRNKTFNFKNNDVEYKVIGDVERKQTILTMLKSFVKDKYDGTVLTTDINTKGDDALFQCSNSEHPQYKQRVSRVLNEDRWCNLCKPIVSKNAFTNLIYKEQQQKRIEDMAKLKNLNVLSKYESWKDKLKLKCNNGHEPYEIGTNVFMSSMNYGNCPKCRAK